MIDKLKKHLLYGGIDKKEFDQVRKPISEANHKALRYWSLLVSCFWIYCLVMSFFADDYKICRPAYIISLASCVLIYLCTRFIMPRFPNALVLLKYLFRLSLIGGGIGIAVCQWNVRSLTLFAVAIISPSIFIDSTISSLIAHCSALVLYILLGANTIHPDIFYWGMNNYILFSVFGLLIGNSLNKQRYERNVYAEYEKKLAEAQMRYANYDRMTGLKNRHAYEDMLLQIRNNPPAEFCIVMADINGLKVTNDTIGHDAGDELLIGASECLSSAFEGIDTIYRIGGDEFCVIMEGSAEKAEHYIERLEELASKWRGHIVNGVSISTGLASSKNHDDVKSVFAEADQKMYESKRDHYTKLGNDRRIYRRY